MYQVYEWHCHFLEWFLGVFKRFLAVFVQLRGKKKGAKKRLNYLLNIWNYMEAESGIEPLCTALQAAA